MKVCLVVAATAEEASEHLTENQALAGNTFKVSAPRKVKIRHGGDPGWKAQQKKARIYYKKNRSKLAKARKVYRKRNAKKLASRREFLKHAPKAKVINPMTSVASTKPVED